MTEPHEAKPFEMSITGYEAVQQHVNDNGELDLPMYADKDVIVVLIEPMEREDDA